MSKSKTLIGMLVGLCLALALAGCAAGGTSSNTGAVGPATTPAPINVPAGYQGLLMITFTPGTTYEQAVSILDSAGMKLQEQCPHSGPILVNATPTPTPTQQNTFADSHELTAISASGTLTQATLTQIASSPQVKSVDKAPIIECPLQR